jgi:hypothetical protein
MLLNCAQGESGFVLDDVHHMMRCKICKSMTVMPRQPVRPLAGRMTGSGGASSNRWRWRLLDRPLSRATTD